MAVIDPDPQAPDSSKPTGIDDDGELFRKLKRWTLDALDHLADWRKEADDAYDFYAGHQWTEAEKQIFEADGRVAPIFNLTAINVDAVCGLEVNNRLDLKFLPRTQGDVQANEALSSAAMWIRDEAQSEDEESDAFKDATITGLGVTETRKAGEEDITVDRRDPRECFYDKAAKKPNLIDRRYDGRVIMMDTDEAEGMFPDVAFPVLNAKWAALGINDKKEKEELLDYPADQRGNVGPDNYRPKKVCLVEIEWIDWRGIEKVKKQAILGQSSVIEINPLEAWAYNWITGKRDVRKNCWYGIVRALKDPQKLVNKFLATTTHIIAANAKGGIMYERGAFTDVNAAERDWSNPQKNVEVTEGALSSGRIQPRTPPPLPAGAVQLMEFALGNIRSVSGINTELLGASDRDQPASLELQRRQSAVTILASLFDAKRRYHKEQGRTLLQLMKTLPPQTLVRITVDPLDPIIMQASAPQLPPPPPGTPPQAVLQAREQAAQQQQQQIQQATQAKQREMFVQFAVFQQALSDPALKFDVIIDEAPSSPNQQQEIVAKLAELARNGLALPPAAQAAIVQSIGLPSTVADKISEALTQSNPQVQQLTQQLQESQTEAVQARAELQGVKMDKSVDQQKANTDQYKAETDRAKAYGDMIATTGGIPDQDGVLHPLAAILIQLGEAQSQTQAQVHDIGTVLAHRGPAQASPMIGSA